MSVGWFCVQVYYLISCLLYFVRDSFSFSVFNSDTQFFFLSIPPTLCAWTQGEKFLQTHNDPVFRSKKAIKLFLLARLCVCVCASFDRNLKTNNKTKLNEVNTMNENKILIKNSG